MFEDNCDPLSVILTFVLNEVKTTQHICNVTRSSFFPIPGVTQRYLNQECHQEHISEDPYTFWCKETVRHQKRSLFNPQRNKAEQNHQ